jgi:hypothetical protein
MRERAEVSSNGPWKRYGMAGVAGADWEIVEERRVECECGEAVALTGCATNADALHIASWHPAVALAVADWLDVAAEGGCCDDCMEDPQADPFRFAALAVADAYLGATS